MGVCQRTLGGDRHCWTEPRRGVDIHPAATGLGPPCGVLARARGGCTGRRVCAPPGRPPSPPPAPASACPGGHQHGSWAYSGPARPGRTGSTPSAGRGGSHGRGQRESGRRRAGARRRSGCRSKAGRRSGPRLGTPPARQLDAATAWAVRTLPRLRGSKPASPESGRRRNRREYHPGKASAPYVPGQTPDGAGSAATHPAGSRPATQERSGGEQRGRRATGAAGSELNSWESNRSRAQRSAAPRRHSCTGAPLRHAQRRTRLGSHSVRSAAPTLLGAFLTGPRAGGFRCVAACTRTVSWRDGVVVRIVCADKR